MSIDTLFKKKYATRIMLFVYTLVFYIALSLVNVPYTPKEDAREREYYPATVVDKSTYESCSKTNCRNYYIITIKLENGDFDSVNVGNDTYNNHNIGDTINFERHITDPEVITAWLWRDLLVMCWLVGVVIMAVIRLATFK